MRRAVIMAALTITSCAPFTAAPEAEGGVVEGPGADGGPKGDAGPADADTPPAICHALSFDGNDDHIDVQDAPELDPSGAMTIEAWIRLDVVDGPEFHVVSHHDHGKKVGYLLMAYGSGTDQQPTAELGASTRFYSSAAPVNSNTQVGFGSASLIMPNKWTHVAATYDGTSTVRVWVNGVRKGEATNAPSPAAADFQGVLRIGSSAVGSGGFQLGGLIDEVRVSSIARYSAAFTPETRFMADSSTIALWHFDEGQGASAGDAMKKHDGAILGPKWTKVDCTTREPL